MNQSSPLFDKEIEKEFIENEIVKENYNLLIESLMNTCSYIIYLNNILKIEKVKICRNLVVLNYWR